MEGFRKEFEEAIEDDLNIPKALGVAWNVVRYHRKSADLFRLLAEMDAILGLDIAKAGEKKEAEQELDPEIKELVDRRQQARKDKNWKLADELRDQLKDKGITLEDTPQGVKVVFKDRS
jgi:cysteinyl-tRNA synthetase